MPDSVERIELDLDGKQILVFHGITNAEFQHVIEPIREWLAGDKPIFTLLLNGDRSVELIKVEK